MLYDDDLHAILKLRFPSNLVLGKARAISYSRKERLTSFVISLVAPPNELRAVKMSVQGGYRRKPQLLENAIFYSQLQKCRNVKVSTTVVTLTSESPPTPRKGDWGIILLLYCTETKKIKQHTKTETALIYSLTQKGKYSNNLKINNNSQGIVLALNTKVPIWNQHSLLKFTFKLLQLLFQLFSVVFYAGEKI